MSPRLLPSQRPKQTRQEPWVIGAIAQHRFQDVVLSDRLVVIAGAAQAAVEVDCSGAGAAGAVLGL